MVKMVWVFVLTLALIAVIVLGLDSLTRSRAELTYQQARARAMVIEAQGQARLDSAQAAALTTAAILPWLVGLGIIALVVTVTLTRSTRHPARIERIETRIVFLTAPQSRRQIWQLVSGEHQHPLLNDDGGEFSGKT